MNTFKYDNTSVTYKGLEPNPETLTQTEKESKVFNLTVELTEAQRERKTIMKTHTENIKRIKSEIKDLVKDNVQMEEV